MPQILCTFPGRTGDLLWALPTIRAISETYGQPVDLAVSQKYGSGLKPLLLDQPYLGEVHVLAAWGLQETAPISPRIPPSLDADYREDDYDRVFHLGYDGWPTPTLPEDIYMRAVTRYTRGLNPLDLSRPWITPPSYASGLPTQDLAIGFTDEHFELKYGIYWLLRNRWSFSDPPAHALVNVSASPRWNSAIEGGPPPMDWETAAAWISRSRCFVGCCSALHVLAVALGVPAVIVEPAAARLQEVFWPLGFDGDRVQVVRGGDGLPTVDARHTAETIETVWARQRVQEVVQG